MSSFGDTCICVSVMCKLQGLVEYRAHRRHLRFACRKMWVGWVGVRECLMFFISPAIAIRHDL